MKTPTAETVAQDRRAVAADLRALFGNAGIAADPPIRFTVSAFDGSIGPDRSDPRCQAVTGALDQHPELVREMAELVYNMQLGEHAQAMQGWFDQVNAGRSPPDADRDMLNAVQRIFDDNGFSFGRGDISIDVEGTGHRLMPAGDVPASNDQKLWREILRLTGRLDREEIMAPP